MTSLKLLAALAALFAGTAAQAAANCPDVPQERWMHVLDMQKKIVNEYGLSLIHI